MYFGEYLVHVFDWGQGFGTTYLEGVKVDATSIAGLNSIDTTNVIWRWALSGSEARSLFEAGSANHAGVASTPLPITLNTSSTNITVSWSAGILESASQLSGPWTPVPAAQTPSLTIIPGGAPQFFRAVQ